MTENLDHETGGTFATDDVITQQCANTKFVLVQAGAPTTPYDGQIWTCTSSDPPLAETYDETNTRWLPHRSQYYRSIANGYKTLSKPLMLNGGVAMQYNSSGGSTSGDVFFYFKANGVYWGLKAQ